MDHLSDADLAEAAKAGDTASFGELVRRHGPRLLALARQLVGVDGAEDVVQEAMIDAYRGLAGFAGNAAVGTWLYRIAVNRCLQERRRRRPLVVDAEPLELLARWEDPDYSLDPAVVAARRSQTETLHHLLDELPDGYRTALLLHDGLGLSAAELADATGIPLGTAKSNIRRSRLALFTLLGQDDRGLLEDAR
jgi:RNA polymerase sigma-70 factor (ECF subfamily)